MRAVAAVSLSDVKVRGGARWFLIVAAVCGLSAAFAATRVLKTATDEVPVVVADRAVAPLTRITAAAVRVERLPAAALPPGALASLRGVIGSFTSTGLVPGEVVAPDALAAANSGASTVDERLTAWRVAACGQSAQCPAMTAMTLPLASDQGFAMVRQGDRVDIVASYTLSSGPVAQVVVQGVPVLERLVDANAQATSLSGAGAASGWLVLGVTQGQALRLELLEASGHLAVLLEPLGSAPVSSAVTGGVLSEAALAGGDGLPVDAGSLPTGQANGG